MNAKRLSIQRAKTSEAFPGRIQVWRWGNNRSYERPKPIKIGFSGSNAKPYSSMHIYLWRIDIWLLKNPIERIMRWLEEREIDRENKVAGYQCPDCGSHKLRMSHGFAYEPICYCKACGSVVWSEDPEPYCR